MGIQKFKIWVIYIKTFHLFEETLSTIKTDKQQPESMIKSYKVSEGRTNMYGKCNPFMKYKSVATL